MTEETIIKLLQNELLGKVRTLRRIDKNYMLEYGKEAPPHLDIHRACVECGQLGGLHVIIERDIDEIRGAFKTLLAELFTKPTMCPKCGGDTIPLGYSWSSLGWMLKGFDVKEVEQYYKVMGTIKKHPKKVHIFQTTTSTMVGVKNLIIAKVNSSGEESGEMLEEANHIIKATRRFPPRCPRKYSNKQEVGYMKITSFSRDRKIEGGQGVFLIDLPQYNEDLSDFKPMVQQELAEWR